MTGTPSKAKTSPLRELLGESELGQWLDRLNADPWIGPTAPGDGDLIQWHFGVCLIALQHALNQNPSTPKSKTVSKSSGSSSDGKSQKFMQSLRDGRAKYARLFLSEATADQQQLWDWLCTLIDEELALQWGGRRVRIKKKQPVPDPLGKVELALQSSIPIEQIAAEIGISRATVYRILKRKA